MRMMLCWLAIQSSVLLGCTEPDYSHTDVERAKSLTVSLRYGDGYRSSCGGVITGRNQVTTVYHCIRDYELKVLTMDLWLQSSGEMLEFSVKTCRYAPVTNRGDYICDLDVHGASWDDWASASESCDSPVIVGHGGYDWHAVESVGYDSPYSTDVFIVDSNDIEPGGSGSGVWCSNGLVSIVAGGAGSTIRYTGEK